MCDINNNQTTSEKCTNKYVYEHDWCKVLFIKLEMRYNILKGTVKKVFKGEERDEILLNIH